MQETAMTFRGSQDTATPPGPQTRFSMTCPFKKPVPRVLEPQPWGIFCKMGLHCSPSGNMLAVSFQHGAFNTAQQEHLAHLL